PRPPLFPYTTLFRSRRTYVLAARQAADLDAHAHASAARVVTMVPVAPAGPRSHERGIQLAGEISRWAKGVSPAKWATKAPAVMQDRKSTRLNSSHSQ